MIRILQRLDRLPSGIVLGLSGVLVVLIAVAELVTGPDLSFHIFYLAPVILAGWAAGFRSGAIIALASATAWSLADMHTGRAYELAITPYWNFVVRLASFLVVGYLLAALRISWNHERELARTDSLTGVRNVRSFAEVVQAELRRSRRFGRPLTIAYLDLDDFKSINDQLGHSAGDDVLKVVAQAMSRSLRAVDVVARLGGDEFAVLLAETDSDVARQVITKVHEAIRESTTATGSPVTASVGAITWRRVPGSVDDLIRSADDCMYEVKRHGKNRVYHRTIEAHDDEVMPVAHGPGSLRDLSF